MKDSTVIVAGGHGLIGGAVSDAARSLKARVFALDTVPEAKHRINVGDVAKLKEFIDEHGCDYWFDCTYPRGYIEAAEVAVATTTHVCRWMQTKGGGSVVLLGSIYGLLGPKVSIYNRVKVSLPPPAYAFVKGGLAAIARYCAAVYPPVRVNCLAPGGVEDNQDAKWVKRYNKRTPLGRMAMAHEVADAAVKLATMQYVTGQTLPVDGGLTVI